MEKAMKIGIMTFHRTTNFGATLQAVATGMILKEIGCVCEIVDYTNHNIEMRENPSFSSNGIGINALIFKVFRRPKLIRKYNELFRFLKENVCISKKIELYELKDWLKKYDAVLIGSDMLWNLKFTDGDYSYFLDMDLLGTRKMAFATSAGCIWSNDEREKISDYLDKFTGIAVREYDLANEVESIIGRKVPVVCDPTMLVKPDVWSEFADKSNINLSNYGLIYMDDSNRHCYEYALNYMKEKKAKLYEVTYKPIFRRKPSLECVEAYSVEDFLKLIRDANVLFTASYHGMLFAIYFHVPFVYYNKDKSRLQNIATYFQLEGCNVESGEYDIVIDWDNVDVLRNKLVDGSFRILNEMIYEENNM